MITIVSFDYFEPFEYLDVGFTDAWAWSDNFAWLGYDSVNFIPSIGSVIIFALIQMIVILITALVAACRKKIPVKCIRKSFTVKQTRSSSVTFMHATFFDLAISSFTCMTMVEYWDFFDAADKVSIQIAILFIIFVAAYLGFAFFFACFRSKKVAMKNWAKFLKKHVLKQSREIHERLLYQDSRSKR